MREHFLIAAIERRLITIGANHAAFQIVRDDQLQHAAEELERPDSYLSRRTSLSLRIEIGNADIESPPELDQKGDRQP